MLYLKSILASEQVGIGDTDDNSETAISYYELLKLVRELGLEIKGVELTGEGVFPHPVIRFIVDSTVTCVRTGFVPPEYGIQFDISQLSSSHPFVNALYLKLLLERSARVEDWPNNVRDKEKRLNLWRVAGVIYGSMYDLEYIFEEVLGEFYGIEIGSDYDWYATQLTKLFLPLFKKFYTTGLIKWLRAIDGMISSNQELHMDKSWLQGFIASGYDSEMYSAGLFGPLYRVWLDDRSGVYSEFNMLNAMLVMSDMYGAPKEIVDVTVDTYRRIARRLLKYAEE